MPIEIKEVVIRTVVDAGAATPVAPSSGGKKSEDNVQALVDQVMDVLEAKNER